MSAEGRTWNVKRSENRQANLNNLIVDYRAEGRT